MCMCACVSHRYLFNLVLFSPPLIQTKQTFDKPVRINVIYSSQNRFDYEQSKIRTYISKYCRFRKMLDTVYWIVCGPTIILTVYHMSLARLRVIVFNYSYLLVVKFIFLFEFDSVK